MTGSGPPQPVSPHTVAPHVTRAAHMPGEGGAAERRLREHVSKPSAPRWIGQVGNGILDLHVDLLHDPGDHEPRTPDELAELRAECSRVARLLSMLCSEQDRRLEEVRTGRLIRVVLQTDEAAAFCLSVVPGQHVVGFQLGLSPTRPNAAVAPSDRVMVELVNKRRTDLGVPSQDPGGLASRPTRQPVDDHDSDASPAARSAPSPMVTGEAAGEPPDSLVATLRDRVLATVDPESLHWTELTRAGQPVFTIDQFGHPNMERHFELMTVEARRKFYGELATDAHSIVSRLGRAIHSVLGGPMRSVVLDVEQGAIAIHRLGPQEYLLGVTLSQDHVQELEVSMATLAVVPTDT